MSHSTTCDSPRTYIDQLIVLLSRVEAPVIDAFVDLLFQAWRDDRQVFVFGDGRRGREAAPPGLQPG